MATLREILTQCNVDRELYIGTAVLPRPLFVPDFDDDDNAGFIVDDILDNNDDSDSAQLRLKRKRIGCATISTVEPSEYDPSYETHYARITCSEFNSIVIEHHLKWSPLVHSLPGPISQYSKSTPITRLGRYDFGHVDTIVDWAISKQMTIKGHVLLWHVTSPVELLETMSPSQVSNAVKRHIFTTLGYYIDRIQMWDVVNEALAHDGSLVQNIFYRKMGPNYIAQCFKWAHEANPNAFLIYNDNKVEGCGGSSTTTTTTTTSSTYANQAKADGFYNLLKTLVNDGIPIHGAGMQAHFDAAGTGRNKPPTPSMVKRQIHRIGQLGLKVNISEMDVRVSKLSPPPPSPSPPPTTTTTIKEHSDMVQTTIYRDILTAAFSEPCFHGIWFWGFSDRHTWVKNFYHDDTPLIYDEMYEKKPSYFGVVDALKTTTIDTHDKNTEEQIDLLLDDDDDDKWGCDWMVQEPPSDVDDKKKNIHYADRTKECQPDWLQPN